MPNHLIAGKRAEDLALEYLQSRGLKLVTRNWRSVYGEIDLIMTNKTIICFVEVRYRKQSLWGMAEETITYSKRQKLIKTATLFLQKNNQFAIKACQFDVVALTGDLDNPEITWLANAFVLAEN